MFRRTTSAASPPTPPAAIEGAAILPPKDRWQEVVDHCTTNSIEALRRCRTLNADLAPSPEVLRETADILLTRALTDTKHIGPLFELRALLTSADQLWLDTSIIKELDRIVRELAQATPTPLEFLPVIKVLLQFSGRGLRPDPDLLHNTIEMLTNSGIKLAVAYRDSTALGVPLNFEGSTADYRLRLANGFTAMYGTVDDSTANRLLDAVVGTGDPTLIARVGAIIEHPHFAQPGFRVKLLDSGEILDADALAKAVHPPTRTLSETIVVLAEEGDIQALSQVEPVVPQEQRTIPRSVTDALYGIVCSRSDFGSRTLGTASLDFCNLLSIAPVPSEILQPQFAEARERYLNPLNGRILVGSDRVHDYRFPALEAALGFPDDLSEGPYQVARICASALGYTGCDILGCKSISLHDAIIEHLERVKTHTQLTSLLNTLKGLPEQTKNLQPVPFCHVLRAGHRAGLNRSELQELYSQTVESDWGGFAPLLPAQVLDGSRTAAEFLDWSKRILCRNPSELRGEYSSDQVMDRLFKICLASFAADDGSNASTLRRVESLLGLALTIPPEMERLAFVSILCPILDKGDSDRKRAEIWRDCADGFAFLRERTGTAPDSSVVEMAASLLFSNTGVRRQDIAQFESIVGQPLSPAAIEKNYGALIGRMVMNRSAADAERMINELEAHTGVSLQIPQSRIESLTELASQLEEDADRVLQRLWRCTGYTPEGKILEELVVRNAQFSAQLSLPLPRSELDSFLASPENKGPSTYLRLGRIFSCTDYFLERRAKLLERTDIEALRERLSIAAGIAALEHPESEAFTIVRKDLISVADSGHPELTKSIKATAKIFAARGDLKLLVMLCGENFVIDRFNLVGTEFFRNPTPDTQEALWRTLSRLAEIRIDLTSLYAGVLLGRLPEDLLSINLQKKLNEAHKANSLTHIEDITFLDSIRKIPGLELRAITQELFVTAMISNCGTARSFHSLHRETPSIPRDVFVQVGVLVSWEPDKLGKFEDLYRNRMSRSAQEALRFAVTQAAALPTERRAEIVQLAGLGDSLAAQDPTRVAELLTVLAFADPKRSPQGERSAHEPQHEVAALAQGSLEGLLSSVDSETPLNLAELWQRWDNPTALLVFLTKLQQAGEISTLQFLKELLPHTTDPTGLAWKARRYGTPAAKLQLAILPEEKHSLWSTDVVVPLGSIAITSDPREKGERVLAEILETLRQTSRSGPSDSHPELQPLLRAVESLRQLPEGEWEGTLRTVATFYDDQLAELTDLLRIQRIPALRATLDLVSSRATVPLNTKTRSMLAALRPVLPQELRNEPLKSFQALRQSKRSALITDMISPEVTGALMKRYDLLVSRSEALERSGALQRHSRPGEPAATALHSHRRIRQLSLYRTLTALSVTAVALSRELASDSPHASTLITTAREQLNDLSTKFGSLQFHQCAANIRHILDLRGSPEPRPMAMLWTDNAEVLLQIGKYPLGSSSCKNYEGSAATNKTLAADIGDAHIRALLLLDMNRLSQNSRVAIQSLPPDQAVLAIRPQEVLRSCMARSLVKLVAAPGDQPALFVEDTYSPFGSRTGILERHFEQFVSEQVSAPLGAKTLREGGEIEVTVPETQNPGGQYEDRRKRGTTGPRMGILHTSYLMKAAVVRSAAEQAARDKERLSMGELVRTPLSRTEYLEERFNLRTLVRTDVPNLREFEVMARSMRCHVLAIEAVSGEEGRQLQSQGFIEVPSKIGYQLTLPETVLPGETFLSSYLARFSSETRRKQRRAYALMEDGITAGTLSYRVDRGHDRPLLQSFLDLYQSEMGRKTLGWTPLLAAIAKHGGGLTQYIRADRTGIFLCRENRVIAGLIASRGRHGYSIDYQTSDSTLRDEIPEMSRYLITKLLEQSYREGYREVSFGVDTNLYGHHLSIGLLRSKIQMGFVPIQVSSPSRLIKFIDRSALDPEFFHFGINLRGELTGYLYGEGGPSKSWLSLLTDLVPGGLMVSDEQSHHKDH